MPYTPSALKVFRSAWIPAPPPESEPAIESARGLGGFTPPRLPSREVVPPRRRERMLRAVGVHRDEALGRDDLADLGERHAEGLVQLIACGCDRAQGHRRQQLVVLAARKGQLERLDPQLLRALGERGRRRGGGPAHAPRPP